MKPSLFRAIAVLAWACLLVGCVAGRPAFGQPAWWVDVRLDGPDINAPSLNALSISVHDTSEFPPDILRYSVTVNFLDDSPPEDITQMTTWTLLSRAQDAAILAPGLILLHDPCAKVVIRVSMPGRPDKKIRIGPCLDTDSEGPEPGPPDNNPPITNPTLEVGCENALQGLRGSGLPTQRLQEARNTCDQRDTSEVNAALRNNMLGENFWLRPSDHALTTFPLTARGSTHNNGRNRRTQYTNGNNPLIVFSPQLAADLAAGNFRDASGNLNSAVRTLVHELLHVIIDQDNILILPRDMNNDGDTDDPGDESSEEIEELIAHNIEVVLDTIDKILRNLAILPRTPELNEQLRKLLQLLQNQLRGLKLDACGNTQDPCASLDQLFDRLDWEDADHNFIPDFLQRIMEERGIPWTSIINPGDSLDGSNIGK
jgi:hypothetical protein